MSIDLNKVADMGECSDWLECPDCGKSNCHIQQDPEYIYFFCDDCDMYSHFEIARWTGV